MELESYFEFIDSEAIRLRGTRVGIETILRDYQQGASPEEIVLCYPTLSLEQVHATITYYLANQETFDSYIEKVTQKQEEDWQEQKQHPSEFVQKLRRRLEQQRRSLYREKLGTSSSTVGR
jgi:uncharacterized protein (DUF433 family)